MAFEDQGLEGKIFGPAMAKNLCDAWKPVPAGPPGLIAGSELKQRPKSRGSG